MTWHTLHQIPDGAYIELKGYLFQQTNGRWLISTDSGLKSCCIGSANKKDSQIWLDGDFSGYPSYKPRMVGGKLHRYEECYMLSQAKIVHTGYYPIWTIGFITCCILIGIRRFYSKTSSSLKR